MQKVIFVLKVFFANYICIQGNAYLLDLALDETLPASSDTEPAGIVFIDPFSKVCHSIFYLPKEFLV